MIGVLIIQGWKTGRCWRISLTLHYGLSNVIIRNKSCQILTKVKHYYALILHRKSFKLFLYVAKLPKVLYKYFFKQICGKLLHLFANNMKGWSHKLEILHVRQPGHALKKLENNKFVGAALLCANIFQIFS